MAARDQQNDTRGERARRSGGSEDRRLDGLWDLRPSWQRLAACRGEDPAVFFPPRNGSAQVAAARGVCRSCPVKEPCLEYGLRAPVGVWGGLSVKERRAAKLEAALGHVPHGVVRK
jgi:WhiB family redox-sensing transcriptional regulator